MVASAFLKLPRGCDCVIFVDRNIAVLFPQAGRALVLLLQPKVRPWQCRWEGVVEAREGGGGGGTLFMQPCRGGVLQLRPCPRCWVLLVVVVLPRAST